MQKNMCYKKTVISGLIFLIIFTSSIIITVSASSEIWTQTYGGIGKEMGGKIVADSDGGFVISGMTNSFGAGDWDYLLIKTDQNGNVQWNKTFGGIDFEGLSSGLVKTMDGGFAISGSTRSFGNGNTDFWLIKTDSNGNTQWSKTYGGTDGDDCADLIVTSDGGFALVGSTESFGNGGPDFWLIKTDSNGNMEWNQTYGTSISEIPGELVETSDGGYVIVGTSDVNEGSVLLVKIDNAGNIQWSQFYGGSNSEYGRGLVSTSDQGFAIIGLTDSFGAGNSDFWLIKTDSNGNMEWNQTYGGEQIDYGVDLVNTIDGGFALAGFTGSFGEGDLDFWLVKTDATGNTLWNQTYGGEQNEIGAYIVGTSDGRVALLGQTNSFGAGEDDIWLVKIDDTTIIPEFPSWTILPMFLIATLSVITLRKKLDS